MTVATIFLGLIAFAQLTFMITLVFLFKRIVHSMTASQQALQELTPKLGRFIDETSGRMNDLKSFTENANAVTEDIRAITGRVRGGVDFVHSVSPSRALWAGVKAGLAVLASKKAKVDGKGDQHGSED